MADGTKIEWTDATWNVVNGCSVLSPGCTNCYAMRLAGTRLKHHRSRAGLTLPSKSGPVWNGQVRFNEAVLLDPIKWRRSRRIFVCAHGDLFHDKVTDAVIDQVFAVMARAQHHSFQVLTKRAARMRDYLTALHGRIRDWACDSGLDFVDLPLPNVWLGVSVEDQARADQRIPHLLATPAAVRWLSCEPLLGPVDLRSVAFGHATALLRLDWIVAGGESGPGARPMHPDWARSLRDQCARAGVPFLFKQWGQFATVYDREREDPDWRHTAQWARTHPRGRWLNLAGGHGFHGDRVVYVNPVGKSQAGRLLDGIQHDGFPA